MLYTPEGRWVVCIKGNLSLNNFEIAIVREDYEVGVNFYGFYDSNKILISYSNLKISSNCIISEEEWKDYIEKAIAKAYELNSKEFSLLNKIKVIEKPKLVENKFF